MTENEFTWPERDPAKGTWFGSPELKAWCLAKMISHRAQDEIIQGVYQQSDPDAASGYRGCWVGCTMPRRLTLKAWSEKQEDGYHLPGEGDVGSSGSWHQDVEDLYGIPWGVANLLDDTFENQGFGDAAEFAVASIEAIPVGVVYPDPEDLGIGPYDTAVVLKFLRTEGVPA